MFISQHYVSESLILFERVNVKACFSPLQDFLDRTGSIIYPLCLHTTDRLLQRLHLDDFSLFLICSSSLRNLGHKICVLEEKGGEGDKCSLSGEHSAKPPKKAHVGLIDPITLE